MKILIIDDSLLVRNSIKRFFGQLNRNNSNIFEAPNGKIGLKVFEKEQPDLMVLDLLMPEVDGVAVLKALKKIKHSCFIAVLSSNFQLPMKKRCMELGANIFIDKPITIDKMEAFLDTGLRIITKNNGKIGRNLQDISGLGQKFPRLSGK